MILRGVRTRSVTRGKPPAARHVIIHFANFIIALVVCAGAWHGAQMNAAAYVAQCAYASGWEKYGRGVAETFSAIVIDLDMSPFRLVEKKCI